jgi:tetratricopeptide (TPR) repeat protein/tRNA A-37 threonylcarbamoyl transferase component Bud32
LSSNDATKADAAGAGAWHEEADTLIDLLKGDHPTQGRLPVIPGHGALREVARGGQGIVYDAVESATGRHVAIKVLHESFFASRDAAQRFEREFQVLRTLRHPGIVGVLERGATADGRQFLSMEFVQGQRLDEWAAERRPAGGVMPRVVLAELLEMFRSICSAVLHAHQRGVVHRDLKPSNVRIETIDGALAEGRPRILDFGIAKIAFPADESALQTISRQFLGTPAYAAPEQVAGRNEDVDVRTDVHALGVILYEMLTGRLPYRADAGLAATFNAIAAGDPVRPSRIARLDAEIDAIVLKAIAKERADRYQSVDALIADVDKYAAGQPIGAHPPGSLYELRKWVKRNRLSTALAALLVAAVVGLAVFTAVSARREARAATREAEVATREADLLAKETATLRAKDRLSSFLLDLLTTTDPYRAHDPARSVDDLLVSAVESAPRFLGEDPQELAKVYLAVGVAQRTLGRYDRAEKPLSEAARLLREVRDRRDQADSVEALADALGELGQLRYFQHRLAEAETLHREALALRRGLYGDRHAKTAASISAVGEILAKGGRFEEAEPLLREALEITRSLPPEERSSETMGMHLLARLFNMQGRHDEALDLETQALAQLRERGAPDAQIAAAETVLGDIAFRRGDMALAARHYDAAVTLSVPAMGTEHEDVAMLRSRLAAALANVGEFARAIEHAREAARVYRALPPPHDDALLGTLIDLGFYSLRTEDLDGAAVVLEEALGEVRDGVHPPGLLTAVDQLGFQCIVGGRGELAEPLLQRVADAAPEVDERSRSAIGGIHATLSWLAAKRVDVPRAVELLESAIAVLEPTATADGGSKLALLYAKLAVFRLELGQRDLALPAKARAEELLAAWPADLEPEARAKTEEALEDVRKGLGG